MKFAISHFRILYVPVAPLEKFMQIRTDQSLIWELSLISPSVSGDGDSLSLLLSALQIFICNDDVHKLTECATSFKQKVNAQFM